MPRGHRRFPVLTMLGPLVLFAGCEPVPSQPAPTTAAEPAAVEVKVVKLGDLDKAIAANRGKVVLVDIWGEY